MRQNALELQRLIAGFLGNPAKILAHISCSGARTCTRMPDFARIFAHRTRESSKPDTRPKSLRIHPMGGTRRYVFYRVFKLELGGLMGGVLVEVIVGKKWCSNSLYTAISARSRGTLWSPSQERSTYPMTNCQLVKRSEVWSMDDVPPVGV
jgi:hypothetical protein